MMAYFAHLLDKRKQWLQFQKVLSEIKWYYDDSFFQNKKKTMMILSRRYPLAPVLPSITGGMIFLVPALSRLLQTQKTGIFVWLN